MAIEDFMEFINPAKICIALWLRDHIMFLRNVLGHNQDESGYLDHDMTPKQRKNVCMIALKLIQESDVSFADLVTALKGNSFENPSEELPPFLYSMWTKNLIKLIKSGVTDLIDFGDCVDKLLDPLPLTVIHRSSIVGIFLRKLLLGFQKIDFPDLVMLFRNLEGYYREGISTLRERGEEFDTDLDESSFDIDTSAMRIEKRPLEDKEPISVTVSTQRQSELYISRQAELLTSAERFADSPQEMDRKISQILMHNPNMTEAHFLGYLNCLRVSEFTGAVKHLYNSLKTDSGLATAAKNSDFPEEDLSDGFRYAALNLAALHARFGEKDEATLKLRESMMLAQGAKDHVCLQHILTWLYRLESSNKKTLIERCIVKSQEHKLTYLATLGIQNLAKLIADKGGSPTDAMNLISQSDVISCLHSLPELVASGFSLKSAFWSMYGRANMSCITSQLLLLMDTSSGPKSMESHYRVGEDTILACANLARHMNDRGYLKEAEKTLNLARSLCTPKSQTMRILMRTEIQIGFERAILQTNWKEAERFVDKATSDLSDTLEPLLMEWQLHICKGDCHKAALIGEKFRASRDQISFVQLVRSYILESELACLNQQFQHAVIPLMSATKLCRENHLTFLGALVAVHVSHLLLQFDQPDRALASLRNCLPVIMGHGSIYEMSRARLLHAKCLIASASKDSSSLTRTTMIEAVSMLRAALEDFKTMKAFSRAKDVVYLLALVYNSMDMIKERNQCAVEFKKLDINYRTNNSCHLANIL